MLALFVIFNCFKYFCVPHSEPYLLLYVKVHLEFIKEMLYKEHTAILDIFCKFYLKTKCFF